MDNQIAASNPLCLHIPFDIYVCSLSNQCAEGRYVFRGCLPNTMVQRAVAVRMDGIQGNVVSVENANKLGMALQSDTVDR